MFFLLFCHVPLLNLFCQTCWKFPGNETFAFDCNVEAPHHHHKVLLSTVYISITFPVLFDAYRHFISYLCYINWYAKINTLNACNHLATSYSHIPKTCAFDYYTNTCINISTFLEQFCLWSKHFFSQCSDTKIHASFRFLFRNLEQPTLHMQTHIWKV